MKNLTHFIFLFCTAVSCHVFVQGVVAQESSEVLYERKRTILENTLPPSLLRNANWTLSLPTDRQPPDKEQSFADVSAKLFLIAAVESR